MVVYGSSYGMFWHIATVVAVEPRRYEVIEQNFLGLSPNLEGALGNVRPAVAGVAGCSSHRVCGGAALNAQQGQALCLTLLFIGRPGAASVLPLMPKGNTLMATIPSRLACAQAELRLEERSVSTDLLSHLRNYSSALSCPFMYRTRSPAVKRERSR
jgi:hypothetical protein